MGIGRTQITELRTSGSSSIPGTGGAKGKDWGSQKSWKLEGGAVRDAGLVLVSLWGLIMRLDLRGGKNPEPGAICFWNQLCYLGKALYGGDPTDSRKRKRNR